MFNADRLIEFMESLVKDVPRKVFLVVDKHKTVGDKAAKGLRRRTGRRDSGSRHEFRRIDVPSPELRQSHKYLELIPGQSRRLYLEWTTLLLKYLLESRI